MLTRTIVVSTLMLSAVATADPIKLQPSAVTASSSWGGNNPQNAVDGDSSTYWNSGGWAPQWIQLDLGRPMPIQNVQIQFLQTPAGVSQGTISVGATPSSLTVVSSWNVYTYDGTTIGFLENSGSYHGGNVRYVRVTVTSSPSWIGFREISVYGSVEYMGYFRSAFGGDDHITETVAAGANLVWIDGGSAATKLAEARQAGAKAIVDVDVLLGGQTGIVPPDWQTQWANIAAVINNGGYLSTVAGFALRDEPYANYGGQNPHPPSYKQDIDNVAAQIKATFPSTKIITIMSQPELVSPEGQLCQKSSTDQTWVTPNSKCYESYDWIGFDCYNSWNQCNTPGLNAILKSWLSANQRLVAVPQAKLPWGDAPGYNDPGTGGQTALLNTNIDLWEKEIRSDGRYVAIIPYLWQADTNTDFGARDLPWVKERLSQIGRSYLTNTTQVFPVTFDQLANGVNIVSGTYTSYYPFSAFDEDPSSFWNAGQFVSYPYPYIIADLGGLTHVSRVDLTVEQDRVGGPPTGCTAAPTAARPGRTSRPSGGKLPTIRCSPGRQRRTSTTLNSR